MALQVMGGVSDNSSVGAGGGEKPHQSGGGPLADKSAQSIMSNVEVAPSRARRLTSVLGIGLTDSETAELAKSHSLGNLSSMSIKSLGVTASKAEGEKDDAPGNQGEDADKAESTGVLYYRVSTCGVSDDELSVHFHFSWS